MWFETHAHLSDAKFDDDRDAAIQRAVAVGVTTIIEIADGPAEWSKAEALSEKYPDHVWWAAGLHPYYADQSSSEIWTGLKALTRHPRFVAIGEVGLDYAKCPIPHDQQKQAFESGINVSLESKKPLIVHCRDAYADLMPILRKYLTSTNKSASPGVIHCFSGDAENAAELVGMGFFIGVDGPITYPNANGLRQAINSVPIDRLVLETDSPYLPPQSRRGQRNEPALLPEIGSHLAVLRHMTLEKFSEATYQNSRALFRLNHT